MLEDWALKWGIPASAIEDLRSLYYMEFCPSSRDTGGSEAAIQNHYRIEEAKKGAVLWRNNVGAVKDDRGNFFRYGLCNESARMNTIWKSGDLIGIRPVKITQDMVGTTIGRFVSAEVKRSGWVFSNTLREAAQQRWIDLVVSLGGEAHFVSGGK